MRGTERYGQYYWCVKVPESISSDGEIYLYADKCMILPDGTIQFIGIKDDEEHINLAFAQGQWFCVFAASVIDGAAVAVEHWAGEVLEAEGN